MQDMMLSGPPRLLGLVVQDPIQKYNYRPDYDFNQLSSGNDQKGNESGAEKSRPTIAMS